MGSHLTNYNYEIKYLKSFLTRGISFQKFNHFTINPKPYIVKY